MITLAGAALGPSSTRQRSNFERWLPPSGAGASVKRKIPPKTCDKSCSAMDRVALVVICTARHPPVDAVLALHQLAADQFAPQRGAIRVIPLDDLVDLCFGVADTVFEPFRQPPENDIALLACVRYFRQPTLLKVSIEHLTLPALDLDIVGDRCDLLGRDQIELLKLGQVVRHGRFFQPQQLGQLTDATLLAC